MTDEIRVTEAAELLDVSGQTVRNYVRQGLLSARQPGARTLLIDRASVDALLLTRALRGQGNRRRATTRGPGADELARERDDLRARVVELQDAVLRLRAAAGLQRRADAERATQIGHLEEALRAATLAGELDRRAAIELEEAVAGMALPGHPGDLADS